MAKKITDLTALAAGEADDYFVVYEDSSGITKKIKLSTIIDYIETGSLTLAGDLSAANVKVGSNNVIEGLTTGNCVIRQSSLVMSVGGTIGTNINAALQASLFQGDTDSCSNLAKGATSGNWTLNAGGTTLTLAAAGLSGNCLGVLAYGLYKTYIGSDVYTLRVYASSNDMKFEIYDWNSVGAAKDWTTVLGAVSEILYGYVTYITSA